MGETVLVVPPSGGSLEIGNFLPCMGRKNTQDYLVPPSGGSLEIGNVIAGSITNLPLCSPFGGIPRNWKLSSCCDGRSQGRPQSSPFGGIPRNWKRPPLSGNKQHPGKVPPSGGSLEIGNCWGSYLTGCNPSRSPFGGIPRNWKLSATIPALSKASFKVPPSGGSLEIGNGPEAVLRLTQVC